MAKVNQNITENHFKVTQQVLYSLVIGSAKPVEGVPLITIEPVFQVTTILKRGKGLQKVFQERSWVVVEVPVDIIEVANVPKKAVELRKDFESSIFCLNFFHLSKL